MTAKLDYTKLHEFADAKRISYNELCAVVHAALAAQAVEPLSEREVIAAALALSKRHAELCNVNADDLWNLESDSFKDDARAALEAADRSRTAPSSTADRSAGSGSE